MADDREKRKFGDLVTDDEPESGYERSTVAMEKLNEKESIITDLPHTPIHTTAAAMEKLEGKEKEGHQEDLRHMFDVWAEEYKKVYKDDIEREEMFAIFCSSVKNIEKHNSLNHGYTLGLTKYSDWKSCKFPFDDSIRNKVFCKIPPKGQSFPEIPEISDEELKEARMVFEKWVEKHGKVYGSKEEQEKRFAVFLYKKRRIDEHNKSMTEYGLSTTAVDGWYMDMMWWEGPKGRPCKPGCRCKEDATVTKS